jgi:hypothetical protein
MPVSTRSHTKNAPIPQQQQQPHQCLKEKLKALTLLYEQQNLKNRSFNPPKQEENNVVAKKKKKKLSLVDENRIRVFVRVRPIAKKEAGSRCCVKIVNRCEVYLTEFAAQDDYLRLKRVRGRHFTFDACFSDSATQHEVYSTS